VHGDQAMTMDRLYGAQDEYEQCRRLKGRDKYMTVCIRRIVVFGLLACFGSTPAWPQTSLFQFMEKPGSFPVGLKVVDQYDKSRGFPASSHGSGKQPARIGARPLQTLIWFPSLAAANKPMTVGDYVKLADTETHFNTPDEKDNRWRSQLQTSLDVALRAARDAPPAPGHYPVLIYAPSDSSVSWENADLCEYIASHGYIVLASPSMGASTRDMTDDLEGITTQARDISFLVTYAESLSDADMSKVAVVSWSWGGGSSVVAAARDPRIDALVSMDGSMRVFPGLMKLVTDLHPERMTIPMLFFLGGYPNLLEDLQKYYDGPAAYLIGPNVLNAWHGDLFILDMLGMAHPEFSSMFQRKESAQRFAENQVADYGRDDANTYHALAARYTLNFLDAYLKHDASAVSFLKRTPAENAAPKHFMAASFRAAQPVSATNAGNATGPSH
jgi:pimeloyl-ACP methyl ester carboxylesterase